MRFTITLTLLKYETVMKLVEEWNAEHNLETKLIVTHSHSHDDHVTGDSQFLSKPNVTYVGTELDGLIFSLLF